MNLYSKNDEERYYEINDSEKKCPNYRSPWRRDYTRLLHSPSFRRLQGKTQLFSCRESDFFRNRLTHSLEVAQIGKSITQYLNFKYKNDLLKDNKINEDIVEFAGLAHDLGHPPFGYKGERALDCCMKSNGGFEGNAQTFRILTKIEKKEKKDDSRFGIENGLDNRSGLNLTFRSIASIFKNDKMIPKKRPCEDKLSKGFYYFDDIIVKNIKKNIVGQEDCTPFRTIECNIMDIADDIANATYDLEDSFKAGFVTPIDLLSLKENEELLNELVKKLSEADINLSGSEVIGKLYEIFGGIFVAEDDENPDFSKDFSIGFNSITAQYIDTLTRGYIASRFLALDGYDRTDFTSSLIDRFINGIEFIPNDDCLPLSKVIFNNDIKIEVEVLKQLSYLLLINSSRVKVSEYRGYEMIEDIFNTLVKDQKEGYKLLPEDFRSLYLIMNNDDDKKRGICDFIAGMTDRYAIEFYGRLHSENPETIFKEL